MSTTEAVKRRGRPKKVVEEVSAAEDAKVKGTRKASTKAAPTTKTTSSSASASVRTAKTTPKLTVKTTKSTPVKVAEASKKAAVASPAKPSRPAPVTPETSKILQKVAQTRAEQARSPPQQAQATAPSSIPQQVRNTTIPLPRNPIDPSNPQARHPQPPTPAQPAKPFAYPSPKLPIIPPHFPTPARPATTAFDAQVAANKYLSTGKLDPKYRPAARRVTAIIVALPVLIVTFWELYSRFEMGEDGRGRFRDPKTRPKPTV